MFVTGSAYVNGKGAIAKALKFLSLDVSEVLTGDGDSLRGWDNKAGIERGAQTWAKHMALPLTVLASDARDFSKPVGVDNVGRNAQAAQLADACVVILSPQGMPLPEMVDAMLRFREAGKPVHVYRLPESAKRSRYGNGWTQDFED